MARDEYSDWRDAEDERIRLAELAAETTRQLSEARQRKDWDKMRDLTDVPPPPVGGGRPAEPEPTVEALFARHKDALEGYLARVDEFLLPEALCRDWQRRVEPLDLARPELGLAAIEGIRDEYLRAVYRHEPPLGSGSTRMRWEERIPRIGREIARVEALFRDALAPW